MVVCGLAATAQNWPTYGGDNGRSGLSEITGPQDANQAVWTVTNSAPTTLGMAVYTFGDRFVTARTIFSPYTGIVECRSLTDGSLIWTSPFVTAGSILYPIGFTQDAVYVHDYDTDSLYALHPDDGSIKWRCPMLSMTFGAYPGCVFACNGDPIVNGYVYNSIFTMRIDKNNGDVLWTNNTIIAIMPCRDLAASKNKVYHLTGGISTPVRLTAIDINTGSSLYSSDPVPGDPDQENPIAIGPDGNLYFWRDNGSLFSYTDYGSGFTQNWDYPPQTNANIKGNIAFSADGDLYVQDQDVLKHINHLNGQLIHASAPVSMANASISVGADSTVYVNTGNGQFIAFSWDLQTIQWQLGAAGSLYCGPALSKEGTMVVTQAGSTIRAFRPDLVLKPVADFSVSATRIMSGQGVHFTDQSSYQPTGWQWTFPGATVSGSNLQNPANITYANPGVYDVTLHASNAQGADSVTKHCLIEVVQATAIPEGRVSDDISVIPNPATDEIRIVHNKREDPLAYRVYDLTGKLKAEGNTSAGKPVVDVSAFPAGMYILRVGERNASLVKFIKY